MTPNIDSMSLTELKEYSSKMSAQKTYKVEIVWRNIVLMAILHISAIYGLYLYAAKAQIKTIIAVVLFKLLSGESLLIYQISEFIRCRTLLQLRIKIIHCYIFYKFSFS